jgi:hypothetical protein
MVNLNTSSVVRRATAGSIGRIERATIHADSRAMAPLRR